MIAFIFAHDADDIQVPGGWTTIFEDLNFFREGNNRVAGYYHRVAQLNEGGQNYQWIVSEDAFLASAEAVGGLIVYRGVDHAIGYTEQDRSVLNSVTHDYTVPAPRDQYAVLVSAWNGMFSGGGNTTISVSDMTLRAETGETGGGGTSIQIFTEDIINPSAPIVGDSVAADYNQNCDADMFSIILEGSFA